MFHDSVCLGFSISIVSCSLSSLFMSEFVSFATPNSNGGSFVSHNLLMNILNSDINVLRGFELSFPHLEWLFMSLCSID